MSNTCSCNCGGKDPKMEEILTKYEKDKSNLIQILNEVQEKYGYIFWDSCSYNLTLFQAFQTITEIFCHVGL